MAKTKKKSAKTTTKKKTTKSKKSKSSAKTTKRATAAKRTTAEPATAKPAKTTKKKAAKKSATPRKKTKRVKRYGKGDKSPALENGLSRLAFIAKWKDIKEVERKKAEKRLNTYVNQLVKKYPTDYLEKLKEALEDEEKFAESVGELNFDPAAETATDEDDPETEREFLEKFSRTIKIEE